MAASSLRRKGFDAYQLKWLAMITMTVDHFGKMFAGFWIPSLSAALEISGHAGRWIVDAAISAGYITIYIILWLTAEGCRHTHNIRAYIGRLLLAGLIAEIPFQLMIDIITGEPLALRPGLTNVMFTLALGALACAGYRRLREKGRGALRLAPPAVCAATASLLHTDYEFFGVLCIFLLYALEDRKKRLTALAGLIVFFIGLYEPLVDILAGGFDPLYLPDYLLHLAFALLAVPILSRYTGQRGRGGKAAKYGFYVYYPLHITVLVLLFVLLT